MIYADHAATTALSQAAYEAMLPWLKVNYGNPSTLYSLAREPRKAILSARETIATAIGALPQEIFFTSGGSESDNWAIKGAAFQYAIGAKIITSPIEHHAVLNGCTSLERIGYQVKTLSVNHEGIVSADDLASEMTKDVAVVSIMLANNEIGTIEPINELAAVAHEKGGIFHTDAVQAVGHIPVDVNELGVDMLSASAHKFNGPKGIGFLYVRSGTRLTPLIDGGSQENGMRAGTENVAGIVGMATALKEHMDHLDTETTYLSDLSKVFIEDLRRFELDFILNGGFHRIPGSISVSFRNAEGEMLLHRLDLMGTAVATGSACDSKETKLSHVIQAVKVPSDYASGTIRVTFGMDNSEADAHKIAEQIARILGNRK